MKQLVIALLTAVIFLTSEATAQQEAVAPQEGIFDSNPLPEEQDNQFYEERGEGLDFVKISPGNYLLVSNFYSKECSQERAEIIEEKLTKAVAMNETSKTYVYFEPEFHLTRINEPPNPFKTEPLLNFITIVFKKEISDESGNVWAFFMTVEQGKKLLDKINSVLE